MTLRRILEVPIADLTFADVEALIREEAEEGPRLELKRGLPANDRDGDPWMKGAKRFSNPARDGLAKEIVALANAYGGAVVVGIDETEDHPKRARGPDPVLIPRIAACAEQMQQTLDSLIDPPLAMLEIRGIERPDSDGAGVLVIRTGPSTRAPHGHGRPPLSYMRRGSRSEPMTMRDLQAALFETRTRGERVQAALDERRAKLVDMAERGAGAVIIGRDRPFAQREAVWFRCTLVATDDLRLRAYDLSRQAAFIRPRAGAYPAFGEGGMLLEWRPRLGGTEAIDHSSRQFGVWFIGDRGVIDVRGLVVLDAFRDIAYAFAPEIFPPVAIQVIAMGERLRRLAKRPDVECAVECEFLVPHPANAISIGASFPEGTPVTAGAIRIGPYSLGGIEDWSTAYGELERGIWHGLGLAVPKRLTFEMDRWLKETDPGL